MTATDDRLPVVTWLSPIGLAEEITSCYHTYLLITSAAKVQASSLIFI